MKVGLKLRTLICLCAYVASNAINTAEYRVLVAKIRIKERTRFTVVQFCFIQRKVRLLSIVDNKVGDVLVVVHKERKTEIDDDTPWNFAHYLLVSCFRSRIFSTTRTTVYKYGFQI